MLNQNMFGKSRSCQILVDIINESNKKYKKNTCSFFTKSLSILNEIRRTNVSKNLKYLLIQWWFKDVENRIGFIALPCNIKHFVRSSLMTHKRDALREI